MENRIRIKEAIALCKENGIKIGIRMLAAKVFGFASSVDSAYVQLNNYVRGDYKSLDARTVQILSKELHTDANFLFDTPPTPSKREKELEAIIIELNEEIQTLKQSNGN